MRHTSKISHKICKGVAFARTRRDKYYFDLFHFGWPATLSCNSALALDSDYARWDRRTRAPPIAAIEASLTRVQSFPPIVSQQSKLLILGSMPGEASLKAGQYYAHPRNAFWQIMGELFGAGPSLPYQERVVMLQSIGVALWDSLQACVRPGSLDASIKEEVANDFPALFAKYPNITHVFFQRQ